MIRALLAPCLLSAALAAMAIMEVIAASPEAQVSVPHLSVRAVTPAGPQALDTERLGSLILARPLFSSSRRPAAASSEVGSVHTPPRLSAIMVGNGTKRVVFDDGGRVLVAREGGHAGPYTVVSIAADRVGVVSASGLQTLRPTPIPNDTSDAAQQATTPDGGLSILQQLQRGQVPHYAVPSAPSIQSLIARMRAQR